MPFDLSHQITTLPSELYPIAYVSRYTQTPSVSSSFYLLTNLNSAKFAEVNELRANVKALCAMAEGWDGYDGLLIGTLVERNALRALDVLLPNTPAPELTPNSNGTLSLEWESSEGVAHLEIGRTRYSFYINPRTGSPFFADGQANVLDPEIGLWISQMLYPLGNNTSTFYRGSGFVQLRLAP